MMLYVERVHSVDECMYAIFSCSYKSSTHLNHIWASRFVRR